MTPAIPRTRGAWRLRAWLALAAVLGLAVAALTWTARRAVPEPGRQPAAPLAVVVGELRGSKACGPTGRLNGVPVGWAPTEQGAVAAAAAYAKVLSARWFLTDPNGQRRRRAVAAMAVPERAGALAASQDRLARQVLASPFGAGLGRRGVSSVLTTAFLGYRTEAYTATTARVALWAVVVYGNDGGLAPQALWTTSTLSLRWAAEDWKLEDVATTPGPVPVHGQDAPSLPRDLLAAAGGLKGFTDVVGG